MNSHQIPDSLYETMSVWGDLGPAVIVSHTGLTVPASSLTLAAVAASGYVRASGTPSLLKYVSQPAVSVTLSATNGNWWLALHADLSTAVSGWTRRAGSHFLTQQAATQPANPAGGLCFAQITVAGGIISAVSPLLPVTSQPLSAQTSNAVAITGGGLSGVTPYAGVTTFVTEVGFGTPPVTNRSLVAQYFSRFVVGASFGGTEQSNYALHCGAQTYLQGAVGVQTPPVSNTGLTLRWGKAGQYGSSWQPTDQDTGYAVLRFLNLAGSEIGSITCTATATAYNTSSDHRLKRSIQALLGGVEAIQRMRPVSFVWNSTDESDIGFLAHELMTVAPTAVQGQPDDVHPDGSIKPQQVDHSKLVPILVAAVKELLARIEVLEQALT